MNDDQPTSWSVVLVLSTVMSDHWVKHHILVLDAGPDSGMSVGEVASWTEPTLTSESWESASFTNVMKRIV